MSAQIDQLGLSAGVSLTAANEALGTIGILCTARDGAIVGLTVRTALPAGAMCKVRAREHVLELGPAAAAPEKAKDLATSLITHVTIPDGIRVHSEFGGLDQARDAIGPREAWDRDLWLVKATRREKLGKLVALDATNFRIANGIHMPIHRTSEIECPDGLLKPGDAGAVVTTPRGRPLGMVIGARPGIAIVAPLLPYLRLHALSLLRLEDAATRYSHVLDLQAQRKRQIMFTLDRTPSYDRRLDSLPAYNKSSDEIRAEHPILRAA